MNDDVKSKNVEEEVSDEATNAVALAEMAKVTVSIYKAFLAQGLTMPEAISLTMAMISQGAETYTDFDNTIGG